MSASELFAQKLRKFWSGIIVHAVNPNTQEVQADPYVFETILVYTEFQTSQGQGLHSETMSKKVKQNKKLCFIIVLIFLSYVYVYGVCAACSHMFWSMNVSAC